MARKLPHNIKATGIPERIARTDAKGKQTQLETRLGRLVFKLAGYEYSLCHDVNGWCVSDIDNCTVGGYHTNPIDALLAAGITDD